MNAVALQFRTHEPSWQSQAAHFSKVPRGEKDGLCTTATATWIIVKIKVERGRYIGEWILSQGLKVEGWRQSRAVLGAAEVLMLETRISPENHKITQKRTDLAPAMIYVTWHHVASALC